MRRHGRWWRCARCRTMMQRCRVLLPNVPSRDLLLLLDLLGLAETCAECARLPSIRSAKVTTRRTAAVRRTRLPAAEAFRHVKHLADRGTVETLPRVGQRSRLHHVLAADRKRIEAELFRQNVEMRFRCELRLHATK